MKLISVQMIGNPKIIARPVFPYEAVEDKNKKMFQCKAAAVLKVTYKDEKKKKIIEKTITNECDYVYDGASIPFNIGKGNMKLLIPALWHDIMCEDKRKIDFQRKISSQIFKELLIQCGVNKITAQIMYLAVDNYQKFMRWKTVKEKEEE